MVTRWLCALVLGLFLAACGGGGGSDSGGSGSGGGSNPPPTSGGGGAPVENFRIEAERESTSAGGPAITITALGLGDDQVTWSLAPESPGTLTEIDNESVRYDPPPSGALDTSAVVNITASSGEATDSISIVLDPRMDADTGTPGAGSEVPVTPGPDEEGDVAVEPGIYLIAGNDFGAGFADGAQQSARFYSPQDVVRDAQGNLYVADRSNFVIRRISPQGVVSTLAGMPGEQGNVDGSGSAARFSAITGLAIGPDGNLYVADPRNDAIRRVTPSGQVSTVGELPRGNPASIAFGPDGKLYIAQASAVYRMAPGGSVTTVAGDPGRPGADNGPAEEARFVELNGIAVVSDGTIYVSDGGFSRDGGIIDGVFYTSSAVRRITPDGTVSTLAGVAGRSDADIDYFDHADGSGSAARFAIPAGLTLDENGILYVADRGNRGIRRVTPQGEVTTIAGVPGQSGSADGGSGAARFMAPTGIDVGPNGTLYVADSDAHTIRVVAPDGQTSTLAGAAPLAGSADGLRAAAQFDAPQGLARDAAGNLYVADTGNSTIRRIAAQGQVTTVAGTPDVTGSVNGTGSAARFDRPLDVAVGPAGDVFITDSQNDLIRRMTLEGEVTAFTGRSNGGATEQYQDGAPGEAQFLSLRGIDIDEAGNLFVADWGGDAVRRVDPQGNVTTLYRDRAPVPVGESTDGSNLAGPRDVTVDSMGNVYVTDVHRAVRKITPSGVMSSVAGNAFKSGSADGSANQARFNSAQSIVRDEEGNLYVVDNRSIRRISPQGEVTTLAGPSVAGAEGRFRNIRQPMGLVMTGPRTLAFTSGNGVFELRLP